MYITSKLFYLIMFLCGGLATCLAQQKLHLSLANGCRHDDQPLDTHTYVWEAETDATDLVRRICEAIVIDPSRILLKSGNVPNAVAHLDGNGNRQIIYNEHFLRKMQEHTGDYWAGIGILAHEIGHHINLDPFYEDGSRPAIELKADEFAGYALARMGATEQQALACAAGFSKNGSNTHPGKSARVHAITRGWRKGTSGSSSQVDSDGDGLIDAQDACPTEYGFAKAKGCPDADDDGIPNRTDDCPYEAGAPERRGCPEPTVQDADQDGVPDVSDKCPGQPGLPRFEGCPDTDGDNIPDHLDQCPKQKGLPALSGCPEEPNCRECPDLVFVKGGTFTMGCDDKRDKDCGSDEKPAHSVTLSDFSIGKYEVTVREFKAFIDATNYQTDADKDGGSFMWTGSEWKLTPGINWGYDAKGTKRPSSEDNHPVIHVSWNDAVAYCRWLSEQTGKNFRLPTEAEWEYAARGGQKSQDFLYSGSNEVGEVAWYGSNSNDTTHPVGQKRANELNLYDMSGNVWEWCSDWYGDYTAESISNPKGPNSGSGRVNRGGSWYFTAAYARCANRNDYSPGVRYDDLGFRVAQALSF